MALEVKAEALFQTLQIPAEVTDVGKQRIKLICDLVCGAKPVQPLHTSWTAQERLASNFTYIMFGTCFNDALPSQKRTAVKLVTNFIRMLGHDLRVDYETHDWWKLPTHETVVPAQFHPFLSAPLREFFLWVYLMAGPDANYRDFTKILWLAYDKKQLVITDGDPTLVRTELAHALDLSRYPGASLPYKYNHILRCEPTDLSGFRPVKATWERFNAFFRPVNAAVVAFHHEVPHDWNQIEDGREELLRENSDIVLEYWPRGEEVPAEEEDGRVAAVQVVLAAKAVAAAIAQAEAEEAVLKAEAALKAEEEEKKEEGLQQEEKVMRDKILGMMDAYLSWNGKPELKKARDECAFALLSIADLVDTKVAFLAWIAENAFQLATYGEMVMVNAMGNDMPNPKRRKFN